MVIARHTCSRRCVGMLTRSDPGAKHGKDHEFGRMHAHFYHLEIIINNKRTVSNVFRRLVRRESPLLCCLFCGSNTSRTPLTPPAETLTQHTLVPIAQNVMARH
jgi:hypothetical protein